MNRWLETDTQKTARNIINVLNESAAGMVKKEINKDKPEEAPKNKKVALEKRITGAAIKGKKPESKNAKMPKKIAKKVVKEELEPEIGNSIEDQIADLQDYLDNTPEVSDEERAEIQAEIDSLISQLGEKEVDNKIMNEEQSNETDIIARLKSGDEVFFRDEDGQALIGRYAKTYEDPEKYDEGYKPENGGSEEALAAAKEAAKDGEVWEFITADDAGQSLGEVYTFCYGEKELADFLTQLREVKKVTRLEESAITEGIEEISRDLCANKDTFKYQMLSRLQNDCDYFLKAGNRSPSVLWAKNVDDHIKLMRDLYNSFAEEDKPEWITLDKIEEYEKEMKDDNLTEGAVDTSEEFFGHSLEDDIDEYEGPVPFDRFLQRAIDFGVEDEAFEKYGSRSRTNVNKLVREYYKDYKAKMNQTMKDNTLEEDLNTDEQNSNFSKSQATLPLNNYQAMGIIISDDGETVQYMYSNDKDGNMYEAEIEYDEDGNPYFVDKEGTSWKINDFMRTDYGLQEASFSDKVSAIKKSLKKKDKRLSNKTVEKSAKNIAGAMAKKESLEQNEEDGWGEDVLEICEPFFEKVERTMYEVRNARRGSYAHFGDTVSDLAAWMGELSTEAEDVQSELDDMKEQLQESDNEPLKEEFFNLYSDFDSLYGISKYSPKELKEFINSLVDLHRISEKDAKIMLDFADKYQKLIDETGYESTVHLKESYSDKLGGDPADFVTDVETIKAKLSEIDTSGFGSHLAVQMVEDWIETCDYQIEKGKRLASGNEFYTEADNRTYKDADEAEYYRNKELYANSNLARHREAMEKAKKACEEKGIKLDEDNYLSRTRKQEPLYLVAYKPEITSIDEVKDKYVKIRGDFHKVIDVKPEGDKFVISFAAGTGTAIGGEFEPATLDEIKRLQLYTENK